MRISDWSSDVCSSDRVAAFKADLEDVELTGLERDGEHRKKVAGQTLLKDGDTLMLKGQPDALERAIASHGLLLAGQHREVVTKTHSEDVGVIEAVVTAESMLVGRAAGRLRIHERYGLNLLAISRSGER